MDVKGFDFDGIWITNPHTEETGRFWFDTENDAAIYYGFPQGFHELWEETYCNHSIDSIVETLRFIFNSKDPGFYDVDMFCDDVRNYPWKSVYKMDAEFQVDFNCALMEFCHQDKHFMLAGQVIVFSELSDWACEVFNG